MEELAKRFAELAEKVGPAALDAARGAVRVEAYSALSSTLVQAAIAAALIYGGKFLWRHKTEDSFDQPFPKVVAVCAFGIAIVCATCAVWNWIDPWTWVAMSNPDLWLAKKVLKL